MSRVRDKNGNVIELSGADLERALHSGEVSPVEAVGVETEAGTQAYDPSLDRPGIHGATYNVIGPEEGIAARERAFYEDEYGSVAGGAAAVGAGAARSLTFGGSDVVLDQLGYGDDLQHLEEVNPGLTTLGEVGGAVGSGLFSGGSGTLARLLAKTPAGALTRATGRLTGLKGTILGGTIEGAAFGAGQGVSNLAITNEPLTAEAVFSEVGMNAIYGASAGAAMGGIAHGLGKTAEFLHGRGVARAERAALEEADFAAQRAEQITNLGYRTQTATRQVNQAAEDTIDTAIRWASGHKVTGSPKQLLSWATRRHQTLTQDAQELLANARAANLGESNLRGLEDALSNSVKISRTLQEVKGLRVNSQNYATVQGNLNRLEGAVRKVAKRFDEKVGDAQLTTVRSLESKLDNLDNEFHAATGSGDVAKRTAYRRGGRPIPNQVRTPDQNIAEGLKEVQEARKTFHEVWGLNNTDVINETVWKRLEKFSPERAQLANKVRDQYYSSLNKLAGRLPDGELKTAIDLGNKEFKAALSEIVPKAGPTDNAEELLKSLGMMTASTAVPDTEGPADDVLRLWLQGKALHGAFTGGGRGRTPWTVNAGVNAARRSSQSLINGGGFLGSAARGAVGSMAAAGTRAVAMGGSRMAQATGKAIARIENAMERLASKSSKAVRKSIPGVASVLGGVSFGDSEDDGKKNNHFKRRAGELAQAMADPNATQQRIHDNLADIRAVHPMVADTAEVHAMKALGFLYDKMPKDPGTIMSLGRSRWVPDDLAVAKWANYVRAVSDPVSVIEDAANGTVSPQAAEVLRVLYPATYAEVQNRLWQRLPEMQENSTYDQRIRLSILFQVPLESTMDPKMMGFIQKRFADENAEQQEPLDTSGMNPEQPTQAQSLLPTGLM